MTRHASTVLSAVIGILAIAVTAAAQEGGRHAGTGAAAAVGER